MLMLGSVGVGDDTSVLGGGVSLLLLHPLRSSTETNNRDIDIGAHMDMGSISDLNRL